MTQGKLSQADYLIYDCENRVEKALKHLNDGLKRDNLDDAIYDIKDAINELEEL